MTKENQKILYEHFKILAKEGKTDKQRVECGKYAKEILDSFPEFETKAAPKAVDPKAVDPKPTTTNSKEVAEEK